MAQATPDNKSVLQQSEPITRWPPRLRSGHLCSPLNAQERSEPWAIYTPHYPGLLVPRSQQLGQGTHGLGTACPWCTRLNCVVFKLTFYLEIISNLQDSSNSTENLYISLTQTHPLLIFCSICSIIHPPANTCTHAHMHMHARTHTHTRAGVFPQPLRSKYFKDILLIIIMVM